MPLDFRGRPWDNEVMKNNTPPTTTPPELRRQAEADRAAGKTPNCLGCAEGTRHGHNIDCPLTPPHPHRIPTSIAERVRNFITDYVSLPGAAYADMLALYVLHTHTFVMQRDDETKMTTLGKSAPRTTPYLYVTSEGPGSGKTRLMELLSEICRSSSLVSGMTGPTMFRMVEAVRPTLFLDEVDTIYSGSKNEELRGVLNSGYKHNGKIARVDEKSDDGFREFSTFCPKVLAGIDNGQVPNTIIDRSIIIRLVKAAPGTVRPFYSEDVEELAEDLTDAIQTWYAANADKLADKTRRPNPIDGLSDRQNDIIRPLLAIADTIPGWSKRARIALAACFREQETPLTPQALALAKVRDYMLARGLDRISSARVQDVTGESAHQVGAWFDAFGLQPRVLHFHDAPDDAMMDGQSTRVRGYKLDSAMTEAFDRFLPPTEEAS